MPVARSASLISDEPREPGPLYAFPPFGLLAASIAAVALGIARGALDDLAALAGAKTPTLSSRKLAERPLTQAGAARAEASVRAARAPAGRGRRASLEPRRRAADAARAAGRAAPRRDPCGRCCGSGGRSGVAARRRQRDL